MLNDRRFGVCLRCNYPRPLHKTFIRADCSGYGGSFRILVFPRFQYKRSRSDTAFHIGNNHADSILSRFVKTSKKIGPVQGKFIRLMDFIHIPSVCIIFGFSFFEHHTHFDKFPDSRKLIACFHGQYGCFRHTTTKSSNIYNNINIFHWSNAPFGYWCNVHIGRIIRKSLTRHEKGI